MVCADEKASGESGAGLEKVVTVSLRVVLGRPKRSRPAHRDYLPGGAGLDQTPSRLPRRSTRCTLTTVASPPGRPKPQVSIPVRHGTRSPKGTGSAVRPDQQGRARPRRRSAASRLDAVDTPTGCGCSP